MNIGRVPVLITFLFCACAGQNQVKDKALVIIENSVEAHGGMVKWGKIAEISYIKNTTLLTATNEIESQTSQFHQYNLIPSLSGTIKWYSNDSSEITIQYANSIAQKLVNNQLDGAAIGKVENEFMAAYFTLCQPFKLLDKGVKLEYLGLDTLEDGKEVEKVMATYPNAEKSDRWWYFFDPVSFRVVANMVDHGRGFSYIRNFEYDEATGIVFNRSRKSYTVDSARNILYLRATYLNEDFKIKLAE